MSVSSSTKTHLLAPPPAPQRAEEQRTEPSCGLCAKTATSFFTVGGGTGGGATAANFLFPNIAGNLYFGGFTGGATGCLVCCIISRSDYWRGQLIIPAEQSYGNSKSPSPTPSAIADNMYYGG